MAGTIKLKSSDGEVFEVEIKVAKCSRTISEMLEHLGTGDNEGDGTGSVKAKSPDPDKEAEETVPVSGVDSKTLKRVIEWSTHHKDDDPSDDDDSEMPGQIELTPWEEEFLKIERADLFSLILAANYLDIKGLLLCCCKVVANTLKTKSPESIRKEFGIQNDLSPEEEEQIRKENEWCTDTDK